MPRLSRALRHRNFRLFFVGQGISLIGTWLTRFAIGLETYDLSHSELQLGLVAFFSQAPTAAIAPFAGVLADRWNRHHALVVTQVAAMLQSAALAALALSGSITVTYLLVLGAAQAVINAFDMPIRQSFVRQMVDDRADLPNAIALNSSLVNVARLVGPVTAAGLVGTFGIGGCFAVDAATYLAVIGSLLAMRVAPQPRRPRTSRVLDELGEGLAYVRRTPLLRSLLLLFAVTGTLGGAYSGLLPAIAEGSLHGGPYALGAMMSAAGVGALVGALYLASREDTRGLGRLVVRSALAVGVGLIALEASTSVPVALPMMFVTGLGLIVQWAATNTISQTIADEDKLGRVISLHGVVFFAGAPIGALLEGALATTIGPIHTVAIAGAGCIIGVLALGPTLLRHARG
jgi:MFS family permease